MTLVSQPDSSRSFCREFTDDGRSAEQIKDSFSQAHKTQRQQTGRVLNISEIRIPVIDGRSQPLTQCSVFPINLPTSRQVISLTLFSLSNFRKVSLVTKAKSRCRHSAPQFGWPKVTPFISSSANARCTIMQVTPGLRLLISSM